MLIDHEGANMHGSHSHSMYYNNFETKSESGSSEILSRPPTPNSSSYSNINDIINQQIESIPINNIANIGGGGGSQNDAQGAGAGSGSSMGPPKKFQLNKMFEKSFDANSNSSNSSTSSGKRANRTRFTDYQIKVLQEFFENNSYPKDSDLEYLSKLLLLSPRVIVVWFQVSCIYLPSYCTILIPPYTQIHHHYTVRTLLKLLLNICIFECSKINNLKLS